MLAMIVGPRGNFDHFHYPTLPLSFGRDTMVSMPGDAKDRMQDVSTQS